MTLVLYNAISGYFTGLKNLANNDLTNYKLGPLKKSISEGNFGSVRIDKTDADSYAKISTILLNASTGAYRKNRLKHYIDSGNEPIQVLMAKFRFIIRENLKELLDFKKEKLYTYYMEMKMSNSLSVYEKGRATIEYYEQLSAINAMQKQISTYAGSLQSIAKGHQDIYDNKNKMTANELKELLIGYTADIQDIISEFNKLKN